VAINPYAPPQARVDDVSGADPAAEAIRREHIQHETSVRSIGLLYYLGGTVMVLGGIAVLVGATLAQPPGNAVVAVVVGSILYLGLGVLSLFVARGVRQLRDWARTTTIVLSFIGLLAFPVGTLINGYILYLLFSAKGKRVFAPDYAAIVAATPHITYRTSLAAWIVLALLVLTMLALVALVANG
jgi:hypothetical protein